MVLSLEINFSIFFHFIDIYMYVLYYDKPIRKHFEIQSRSPHTTKVLVSSILYLATQLQTKSSKQSGKKYLYII